jgi:hypothetical protein
LCTSTAVEAVEDEDNDVSIAAAAFMVGAREITVGGWRGGRPAEVVAAVTLKTVSADDDDDDGDDDEEPPWSADDEEEEADDSTTRVA